MMTGHTSSPNRNVQTMILTIATIMIMCSKTCESLNFGPFSFGNKVSKPTRISGIVGLLEGMNSGMNPIRNDEIINSIQELKSSQQPKPSDLLLVDGFWELLWTTEKETLFFKKNGLFGKECTVISQSIDTKASSINNLIEFDGGRKFSVDGKINIDESMPERVNFQFSGACITVPPVSIPLPPVGKGWFDTIYVDQQYRVSYDVRGDYLISKRMPSK